MYFYKEIIGTNEVYFQYKYNKDDNIRKSKLNKSDRQTNIHIYQSNKAFSIQLY